MYNLFQASKIKKQLQKQRSKRRKQQEWMHRYSEQVQPKLLDSYNKRVNTFMRKMEQAPIVVKKYDETEYADQKLFRVSNKETFLGSEHFRFKDYSDWNSIYTEAQRQQKKNNEKIMQQKFGDAQLAYRSIISQSAYTASKPQFRVRCKTNEINPPMKYASEIPKLMVKKNNFQIKQRKLNKLKTEGSQPKGSKQNPKNLLQNGKKGSAIQNNSQQNANNNNNNTYRHSSIYMDDDSKSIVSFKSIRSFDSIATTVRTNNYGEYEYERGSQPNEEDEENLEKQRKLQQKKFLSPKMHFKTLIQAFENATDEKVKQNMKEVLVKCGIFRNKERKSKAETQMDTLSLELQNNMGSQLSKNNTVSVGNNTNSVRNPASGDRKKYNPTNI